MKFLARVFMASMLLVTLFSCRPSDNELLRQFDVNKKFSELAPADQTKALFLVRRSIGDYYEITVKTIRQSLVGKDSKAISDAENKLKTRDGKLALLMKDDSEVSELIKDQYPVNIVIVAATMKYISRVTISDNDLMERINKAEKDGQGNIKDDPQLKKAQEQIMKDIEDISNEITNGLSFDKKKFNGEALNPIEKFLELP